jgi:hypothetical protein
LPKKCQPLQYPYIEWICQQCSVLRKDDFGIPSKTQLPNIRDLTAMKKIQSVFSLVIYTGSLRFYSRKHEKKTETDSIGENYICHLFYKYEGKNLKFKELSKSPLENKQRTPPPSANSKKMDKKSTPIHRKRSKSAIKNSTSNQTLTLRLSTNKHHVPTKIKKEIEDDSTKIEIVERRQVYKKITQKNILIP